MWDFHDLCDEHLITWKEPCPAGTFWRPPSCQSQYLSNQAPWRPQLPGELSNGGSRTQPWAEMGASVVVHLLPASGGGVYVCVCAASV